MGGSVCTSRTFLFVDQSSQNFFLPTWKGLRLNKFYFRCLIIRSGDIRDQSQSCQISRRNLDVFLALPNFRGHAFQKLYTHYHPCLPARRLEKFHEDTPTSPIFNFHD